MSNEGSEEEEEREEEELTMTCNGVFEMKNRGKATKQLYAYMLHIGSQMTVKALKEVEIVDCMAWPSIMRINLGGCTS